MEEQRPRGEWTIARKTSIDIALDERKQQAPDFCRRLSALKRCKSLPCLPPSAIGTTADSASGAVPDAPRRMSNYRRQDRLATTGAAMYHSGNPVTGTTRLPTCASPASLSRSLSRSSCDGALMLPMGRRRSKEDVIFPDRRASKEDIVAPVRTGSKQAAMLPFRSLSKESVTTSVHTGTKEVKPTGGGEDSENSPCKGSQDNPVHARGASTRTAASGDSNTMQDLLSLGLVRKKGKYRMQGLNLHKVSHDVGIPLGILREARDLFQEFAEFPHEQACDRDLTQTGYLSRMGFDKAVCKIRQAERPEDLPWACLPATFRKSKSMPDPSARLDFMEFAIWLFSQSFSEHFMLLPGQRELRVLARKHGLAIWQVEQAKRCFDQCDLDGSGSIEYNEFEHAIGKLAKVPVGHSIPENRLKSLWAMADVDGSGTLEFVEFLFLYTRCYGYGQDEGWCPFRAFYNNVRTINIQA